MTMVNHWFLLTAGLLASSSCVYSLPTVDGSRNEGSELDWGFKGLTEGVEQMMNFFDDVDSLNRTVVDMSRKLSSLKSIAGDNYRNTMSAHERLDNSTGRLITLEDDFTTFRQEAERKSSQDSILKAISSMNATIVRIDQRIERIEDEVSNVQGTVTRIYQLESIHRAQAEQERRKRELTERLISSPRAKLYTGLNYTGDFESYDFKAPTYKGGCYDLKNLKGKIKSLNTEGFCVRIFKGDICSGWSQALYPGSSVTIDAKLEGVGSIGPCVSNEFECSTLTMSGYPPAVRVNKGAEEVAVFANVPDLVSDYWANPSNNQLLNNAEPITHYKLGQGGRSEAVYAKIYPRHILSSDIAEANRITGFNQSFFPNLGMVPLRDEPGYVVPLELGGPSKEAYNVFAQDKGQAAKYRAFFVPMIKQHLAKHSGTYVIFAVALQYGNSASNRPAGIWYRLWMGGTDEVTYGYLPNSQLTSGLCV